MFTADYTPGVTALAGKVSYVSGTYLVNTKHLYNICTMLDQSQRRWADVVQML